MAVFEKSSPWRIQARQVRQTQNENLPRISRSSLKRIFDVVGASIGLVVLSPLMLMLAALVKFTDGGSVFYGHRRIGRNGSTFKCLKFRTMAANSEELLEIYLSENESARVEWDRDRKLKSDPRITSIGVVLRNLSLDELPQLFNILLGEMSMVGPRPVVSDELEKYGAAAQYYLSTRPGLTGLWQISGRNDVSYGRRVELDQIYVKNWSFQSDLVIIIKTIPVVCLAKGSY
ncbi:sugar transferase [Pararhizobium sp. IMCC21322]|uniref:sugar transferase n=1 Tax=Pararhizobium sp. IMCC21322 TaxID=3067903 RepID=UPI00274141C2|nr:sugar transferase [Pararhizobium sp. IMCC21322]